MRVLLVEDDDDVRLMVRWMLESVDCEVVDVKFAQEALDRAMEGDIDVAVLDHMLAGSDITGKDLAVAFTSIGIKSLIVTAVPHMFDLDPAPEDIPVLPKPFDADRLKEAVLALG